MTALLKRGTLWHVDFPSGNWACAESLIDRYPVHLSNLPFLTACCPTNHAQRAFSTKGLLIILTLSVKRKSTRRSTFHCFKIAQPPQGSGASTGYILTMVDGTRRAETDWFSACSRFSARGRAGTRESATDVGRPAVNPNAFYDSRVRMDDQVRTRELKLSCRCGEKWKIVNVPTRRPRKVSQALGPDSQPAER